MGYYISRAIVGASIIFFLAAITLGIIAVWSDGADVDKIGATAGIAAGASVLTGVVGSLAMIDTKKPRKANKSREYRY